MQEHYQSILVEFLNSSIVPSIIRVAERNQFSGTFRVNYVGDTLRLYEAYYATESGNLGWCSNGYIVLNADRVLPFLNEGDTFLSISGIGNLQELFGDLLNLPVIPGGVEYCIVTDVVRV